MYNSGNSSKNVTGSSVVDGTITNADLATKPVEATAVTNTAGQNWAGVAYTDPDAIGANPTAKVYPDGTVVGSTDNGSYVKHPNGRLETLCSNDAFVPANDAGVAFPLPMTFTEATTHASLSFWSTGIGNSTLFAPYSVASASTTYKVYTDGTQTFSMIVRVTTIGKWK
jgi:hypothetical protein